MSINLQLKADRNDGSTSEDREIIYYPVSNIFWATCQDAGDDLVIEACIQSLYDEDHMNYPANRISLKKLDGEFMVGFIPR